MHDDETRAFLDQLPELRPGERFSFACDSDVPCFNECCRELELALYPYDVLRLRRALGVSSRRFIERHADVDAAPGTGFPRLLLRMRDDERRSCPFVRAAG